MDTEDFQKLAGKLSTRLDFYRVVNHRKQKYYDGKQRLKDLGISIPPALTGIEAVVGWPGTAVDVIDERLDFEGWGERSGLDGIYSANDLDVAGSEVTLDALIYGISFVVVSAGDMDAGEPEVLVTPVSPMDMVAERDRRTNLVKRACQFFAGDDDEPDKAVLYLPDVTVHLESRVGGWNVIYEDWHYLGRVPVVQFVNRPRSSKTDGRSEITPAVRYYTDAALRTLVGAEVAREFYAVPQRYVMGAPESFFLDEDGNPRSAWSAMAGKILAIEADENGDKPDVGSFSAHSMSPFFEQIRNLSQMLASETSIPPTYLGFVTDNPSSADAIRMHENRLVKRAERKQAMFGKGWTEVARLAIMIRDGRAFKDLTPSELAVRPVWRDPATPTRAAAADEIVKMISAGVYTADGDYVLKRLGVSTQDRETIKADRARGMRNAVLESIRNRSISPEAEQLAEAREPAEAVQGGGERSGTGS